MAKEFTKLPVDSIVVNRGERQRKVVGAVQDLADSIRRIGLINPITITRENILIAGERRLEACRLLSEDYKIPVRYLEELNPLELQLIELEENLKRSELSWQEECLAVAKMHQILSLNPDWSQQKTADHLGYSIGTVSERLAMAVSLEDPRIAKADTLSSAKGIVQRETQRAVDNELNQMMQIAEPVGIPKSKSKIFCDDFASWSKDYSGPKFNLIHCDFPYGIDHQDSEQGNISTGMFEGYKDSADTYWKLCTILCEETDNLCLPSAHLMFWFSMKFYSETVKFIQQYSNWELVDERPLVWLKSDNKGIVSDINRRPRNIYETALLFSRGDRKIITPVSNAYACPTSKSFHASEKPEPMLRHFFRMFVDEYAEVLDPTCGSGTSIRAAFNLGAKRSIGLEINPEFAKAADGELTRVKAMKQLEKETNNEDN